MIKIAYIYKLTNKINGKIYVGKTMLTPEERFLQHCRDARKRKCEKRPLYLAMNKYGTENFELTIIEECSDNIVNEREVYWIEKYQSFKNGYNATKGGDGKHYLDYDLVCSIYQKTQNAAEIARQLNIGRDSVINILRNRHIEIKPSSEIARVNKGKKVDMYLRTGEYVRTFLTVHDAAEWINKIQNKNSDLAGITVHIRSVANGKRKTAYGYKWQWANTIKN